MRMLEKAFKNIFFFVNRPILKSRDGRFESSVWNPLNSVLTGIQSDSKRAGVLNASDFDQLI